jgi:hypothetical protein
MLKHDCKSWLMKQNEKTIEKKENRRIIKKHTEKATKRLEMRSEAMQQPN